MSNVKQINPGLIPQGGQGDPLLGTLGTIAGTALGTAVGGPLGGSIGGALGGQLAGTGTIDPKAAAMQTAMGAAGGALSDKMSGMFSKLGTDPMAAVNATAPMAAAPQQLTKQSIVDGAMGMSNQAATPQLAAPLTAKSMATAIPQPAVAQGFDKLPGLGAFSMLDKSKMGMLSKGIFG